MDPLTAATALLTALPWRKIAEKLGADAATDSAKFGEKSLLRLLLPTEREKYAKQAVLLFTEEFLKELDDKSPLTLAKPGYRDQLKRFLESAAPDLAACLSPEIKKVDLGPVARMWSGYNLDPLPEDFDWPLLASNFARALRQYVKQTPELRSQFAVALQEDAQSFDQRHAPGFNLPAYRDFLKKKCGLLQLAAMHATAYDRRITLWSIFVPQSVRESEPVRELPREVLRQLRREGHLANVEDGEEIASHRETYQSSPITGVFDVLSRQRAVVLLGDPGSGKTFLLKYLVLRWISDDKHPLPLWIDLKEYAQEPIGLQRYLESGKACVGLDPRIVAQQLEAGKAALYLDGLDEIFAPRTRATAIEEIAAFSALYPNASIIVTSRIVGYEPERLRHAGFTHATLEDFDDAQIAEFLTKWHAAAEDDPKECARLQIRLADALSTSTAIRELAGNPLLLTMMAILNRNQELPRDRVELYREASRVLLHEWDASRAILNTDVFARQEKEALLRTLAGEMQQGEGGLAGNLIERDRLIAVFRQFLIGLGMQDAYSKAESMVRQLTERNFILCVAGADRFSFVHRTFLEYFCASWFVEQFEKHRTLSFDQLKSNIFGCHWRDETWHEVLRLIAGMVGEQQAGELIQYLMDQDGRRHKVANLLLAAGCLSEVRNRRALTSVDQALHKRVIVDVVKYDLPYYVNPREERTECGPTRTKAVSLIASVWRSVQSHAWIISIATGGEDWIVRQAAVHELARGWKEDPFTLFLLHDRARSDDYGDVRAAAVQELARGWKNDPATLPLLQDRALSDDDGDVRAKAVQELARGWKDDPATLPWLRDRAGWDNDPHVQVAAVQELARGWKGDPATLPWLRGRARSDSNPSIRLSAAQELARGWRDDPATLPLLQDLARSSKSYEVRLSAARELARGWKDDRTTLPLIQDCARSDASWIARQIAVQELARRWKDDPATLPLLKDLVRSDDEDVRRTAVQELARGWEDDPATLPFLQDLVRSDDWSVQFGAARELARGWSDDPATLPLLKDCACSDGNPYVREAAVQELARGWKDDPDTLPLLQDRARFDANPSVRKAAVRELARGWNDDPATFQLLQDLARSDANPSVRKAAVRELARGWNDDATTVWLLKDCARSDAHSNVRNTARYELTRRWKHDPEVIALLSETQETAGDKK